MKLLGFLAAFIDMMAGRIFLILLVGIAASATLATTLADQHRIADIRRIQSLRTTERVGEMLALLEHAPAQERASVTRYGVTLLAGVAPDTRGGRYDADMTALLDTRVPEAIGARAARIPVAACERRRSAMSPSSPARRALRTAIPITDCWLVTGRLRDGDTYRLVTAPPPLLLNAARSFDPAFIFILGLAAAILALIVARMAAAPIRALADGATGLGHDLDAPLLRERGPREVRVAIQAFNAMQDRLRRHMSEQTHMLAAITHDLQTPLTRQRLRLEAMPHDATRERLLADWSAMRGIVDEGLELARSTGVVEAEAVLDVDSMIASIVADEAEGGHIVSFDICADRDVTCRPQMLRRCVQNLVDNAIRHGGDAHLSTEVTGKTLCIGVRDSGPGIPEDRLEDVFEPMVRLETSRSRETGGSGLGLTIARILARRNGGAITLRNLPTRGLKATIRLPLS
jgi:signal transduction histidine kinase